MGLTWNRFSEALREVVPGLPDQLSSDDDLRQLSSDSIARTTLFLALQRIGEVSEEHVLGMTTLGEAYEMCRPRWDGQVFPANLTDAPRPGSEHNREARVRLRPLMPSDVPAMYQAALEPSTGFRWRFQGRTPSLQEFEHALYEGTLAQFVIADRRDGHAIGLVTSYNARFDNGTAWIAFERVSGSQSGGRMFEGMALFIEYLFTTWDLRKLYADIPEFNLGPIGDLTASILVEEGRLVGHEFHDGRWWDRVTLALYRDTWRSFADTWMEYLNGGLGTT